MGARLTAEELYERGRKATEGDRFGAAHPLFLKALDRTDDPVLSTRIRISLSYVVAETGHTERGLALCRDALTTPDLPTEVIGLALSQLALLHLRSGDYTAALGEFDEAVPMLGPSPVNHATALLNRGNIHLNRGDLPRARHDFDRAARLLDEAGEDVRRAKAQHNLGYVDLLGGDLVSALREMAAAAQVLAPLSSIIRSISEQDRAEVLIAAGLQDEGIAALTTAARTLGTRKVRRMQAEAELALARALVLDEPQRATTTARRSARRFAQHGSKLWALRADAVALRAEVETGRRGRDLVVRSHELAERLRREGLTQEAVALDLEAVRVSVRQDDHASAHARLSRIRTTARTPIGTRLLASEVRAELAVAEHRRADAFGQVRRGLDELHAWQSSFGSLDLQGSLVGHGRRLAFQGMRLALADGRPERVFEWSERARALVSRVAPVRPPMNAEAAADLAELRVLRSRAGTDPTTADDARREARLQQRIRQTAWYEEGSGNVFEPRSLREVRSQLADDDAALVAYLVVDERLHALVVAAETTRVRDLGSFAPVRQLRMGLQADLDMAAAALPPATRDAVHAGLRERLESLAEILVSPISDLLGDHRLALTPSGALAGTPWSMLPGITGRPVTIPRSGSIWFHRRQHDYRLQSAGLVAGPRVPRAEEEVLKASSAWPSAQVVSPTGATTHAVSTLARQVDVLHVAAHGRHSADNPLFSGLELVDGPWFGYDIDQLATVPRVVVLSACELGRSSVRWGEEAIGMPGAWLHAGTRCVIASPASVADDVACEVLATTHELMAAGAPPADALATASVRPGESLPASFQCFGSGW